MKRGLKEEGVDLQPTRIKDARITPMKRGLKGCLRFSAWISNPPDARITPMKRGLKAPTTIRLNSGGCDARITPMKRGLKGIRAWRNWKPGALMQGLPR